MPEVPRYAHNECGGPIAFDKDKKEFICGKCFTRSQQIVLVQSARVELVEKVSSEELLKLFESKTIH